MAFALNWEIAWAIPEPGFDHRRPTCHAEIMRGRKALGCKADALRACAHCRNGDRRIRRAKRGCSRFRNAASCRIGQDRQGRDIGILALIRRHALRRITLHMLNRAEVFLRGLFYILNRHIVLEIEPSASFAGNRPKRL